MCDEKLSGIERAVRAAGSQSALARRIGVRVCNVSRWVAKGCVPKRQYAQAIAAKTYIPFKDLWAGADGAPARKPRSDKNKPRTTNSAERQPLE